MFKYLRNIEGNSDPVMLWVKTTATTANQPAKGDAVAISSGLATKGVAGSTAILGIAQEDTNADDMVLVIVDPNASYRVGYTGSSKTSIADSDLFGGFDLKTASSIDLDATTTKVFTILAYDNTNDTADVKITVGKSVL